jgi:hypothetical protein
MTFEHDLAEYGRTLLESVPPVEIDEVTQERIGAGPVRMLQDREPDRARPGWMVGLGAAAVVLVVGGIAAFIAVQSAGDPDVAVPATTSSPTTTEAIEDPWLPALPAEPIVVDTPLGRMEWTVLVGDVPSSLEQVTPWDDGFLALGGSGLLISADGIDWSPVPGRPELGEPVGLAVTADGVYLADRRTLMPEGYRITHPSVWFSPDLESWVMLETELAEGSDRVWGGIAASGSHVVMWETGYGSMPAVPAVLWALDGDRFRVLTDVLPTPADSGLVGVFETATPQIWTVEGGFVTRVGRFGASGGHAFSADGINWEFIEAGDADDFWVVEVGQADGRWLATATGPGSDYLALAVGPRTMLTSVDGLSWQALGDPGFESGSLDIIGFAGGWIAYDPWWAGDLFVSADGLSWESIEIPVTSAYGLLEVAGDVVVASAYFDWSGGWTPGLWVGRILED